MFIYILQLMLYFRFLKIVGRNRTQLEFTDTGVIYFFDWMRFKYASPLTELKVLKYSGQSIHSTSLNQSIYFDD